MEENLRILILEDSKDDVDLIERELKKGGIIFTAHVVTKKDDFAQALKEFKPDVILSDHSLPQFNSIEALKLLHAFQHENNIVIPFILITGTVSEEFAVQSIKTGADDYILKDRLKRLPSSIHSALEKTRIENERRKVLSEVMANEALMKESERMAHFGSWQVDETGKYHWSDEIFRIYGYVPGEVVPDRDLFIHHVHPDDAAGVSRFREEAYAHLDAYESEFRIIDKKGNIKHLVSKIGIKRNQDGKIIALTGFNLDITERKKAEVQLQKSEQEYKSLFDQNPDAVFSLDLEGNFTKVNEGLIRLSGLSEEALLKLNFRPFVAAFDADKVYQHFLSTVKGSPQRYETTLVAHNEKKFIVDVTNMPIVVDGKIVGVHGVAKDITEKKELESLLEQVNRLALIGGWEADLVAHKVHWTAMTKEIHEMPPDFVPSMQSGLMFFKEGSDREMISNAIKLAVEKGQPWDLELQIVTGKGHLRWVRSIGKAESRDGKCARLYGSFQDIHKRKQAEETLKEADQEKITILESIGDAFFAVDKSGTVTYWNKVAEVKLQTPKENILGKNIWDVFKDAMGIKFYTVYQQAMNEQVAVHFQDYYPAYNMWIEGNAYPSPAGLSVYFRDITALRKHMEEIEEQNKKLLEIAWMQSHEVRAPLARIMGLIHLVNTYPEQKTDVPTVLSHILSSAKDLDEIVRKIVRKTEEIG